MASTPLNPSQPPNLYPISSWLDFPQETRRRIVFIYIFLQVHFWPSYQVAMWIHGSQVKGRSFSGDPDIDIIVFHPELVRMQYHNTSKWNRMKEEARKTCPYRIDLELLTQLIPDHQIKRRFGPFVRVPLAKKYVYTLLPMIKHQYPEKEPTPLLPSAHYPITHINQASEILKKRVHQIRVDLLRVLELESDPKTTFMWIYGSQVHGRSRSGKPDIDFYFFHPELPQRESLGWVMWQLQYLMIYKWSFRVDLNWVHVFPSGSIHKKILWIA